jgi:hypothetical protein
MRARLISSEMSKTSEELYEWLEQKGGEGHRCSEGQSFTLKDERAWEKLAAFQFAVKEGWVLKFVQAVSACSEATLEVNQLITETVFTVTGVTNWNREWVEEAVFSLQSQGKDGLHHLAIALRNLVQVTDRPFSIRYCDGEKVVWNGDEFVSVARSKVEGFELRVGYFTFSEVLAGRRESRFKKPPARGDIRCALHQHCHFSPRPILIDGYYVISCARDLDFGVPAMAQPLAVLQVDEERELPSFDFAQTNRAPQVELGGRTVRLDTKLVPELKGNSICFAAGLLSVFGSHQPNEVLGARGSRVLWLHDGVVVHREPLDITARSIALGVVVSSAGLETDISGLIPRENEPYFRRRSEGIRAVHKHLYRLVRRLGREGVTTKRSGFLSFTGAGDRVTEQLDERLDNDLRLLERDLRNLIARMGDGGTL